MRYLVLCLAFLALGAAAFSQQVTGTGYTRAAANAIVENATNYLNEVNASGYIFFYPKLGKAYAYLSEADNSLNTSPDAAVLYAYEAQSQAKEQYGNIAAYKEDSLYGAAFFTVVVALLMYALMKRKTKAG